MKINYSKLKKNLGILFVAALMVFGSFATIANAYIYNPTGSGGGGGGGTPGTPTNSVQFNSAGAFAGSSNLTFDGTATTFANTLNVQTFEQTKYADNFTGADMQAKINAAYAACTVSCNIYVPGGTYSGTTPMVFGTNGKFVSLRGAGGSTTYLIYTPTSGTALTVNTGNPTGHLTSEISGIAFQGKTSLVVAGQTNANTSVGIFYGGTNGAVGINTHDISINGFGQNIQIADNAYMLQFNNVADSGGNGGTNGSLLLINVASNSGERNVFQGSSFTDPGNSIATNAVYITNGGTASNFFTNNSFDDAQLRIGASDGINVVNNNHFENAAFGTYGSYIPVQGVSSDRSTSITFNGNVIANDTSGANSFSTIIQHGGQLTAIGNNIENYGGGTVATFSDHSLDNGVESELICQLQVQGGTLTNIIGGGGAVSYSLANGNTCWTDTANSFPIGMVANQNNVNNIQSGNVTTATYDHSGNWTWGLSGSTYALTGLSSNGLVKTSGGTGALSIATSGTDYQAPITLTTTGTTGPATFTSNTLNIPQYAGGTTYTFSTGLTNTAGTITDNLATGVSGNQTAIGSTTANGTLTFEGNNASTGNTAGNANLIFKVGNSAGTTPMVIANNGNIGMGTVLPKYQLHLQSTGDAWAFGGFALSSVDSSSATQYNTISGNGGLGEELYGTALNMGNGTAEELLGADSTIKFLTGNGSVAPTLALTISSAQIATFASNVIGSGSILAKSGIGYNTGVGAGGTVTQATSKTTGVTLNTYAGTITMNAASLAGAAIASFTVTDSAMGANDVVEINHDSGGTIGDYTIDQSNSTAGSFIVNVRNNTASPLAEALVLRFVIIKATIN